MRHATAATLAQLEPLLAELRGLAALKERKPGTFYRGGRAFVHFHEDRAGLFADVRLGEQAFTRLPVDTATQRRCLIDAVLRCLG